MLPPIAMTQHENTPLARWLQRTGGNTDSLAAELGISRGRANHYVCRASMPRGPVLLEILRLTKLPLEDIVPEEQLAMWNAMRATRRRVLERQKAARKKTA